MNIKNTIWKMATLLNYIFLFKKGIICKGKCLFFFCSVRLNSKNKVLFFDVSVKNTNITITGEANVISIAGKMRNCKLRVYGNANSIYIAENTSINNTIITVRGNNCRIEILSYSTIGGAYIVCMGAQKNIIIDSKCMLAENIEIWNTDSHPIFNLENSSEPINPSQSVYIGKSVWIGKKAIILKGVSIGDNSIIGMASVVTSNIPISCIAAGNPARIIKKNTYWKREFINL